MYRYRCVRPRRLDTTRICTFSLESIPSQSHQSGPKSNLPLTSRSHSDPLSSMTAALTIRGFRFPLNVDVDRAFVDDRVVRLVVLDEEAAVACDELSPSAWDEGPAVVCDEEPVPAAASGGVDAAACVSRLAIPFFVEAFLVMRFLVTARDRIPEASLTPSACASDDTAEAPCPAVVRRPRAGREAGSSGERASGTSESLSLSMR